VSATRSRAVSGEETEDIFEIRTLFGEDRLEYHVIARALIEDNTTNKPLLLAVSLRQTSKIVIDSIRKAIADNQGL